MSSKKHKNRNHQHNNQHKQNNVNKPNAAKQNNQPKANQQAAEAVKEVKDTKAVEAVEAAVETFDDTVVKPAEQNEAPATAENSEKDTKPTEAAKAETTDKQETAAEEEKSEESEKSAKATEPAKAAKAEAADKQEEVAEKSETTENTETKKRGLKKNSIALISVFGACLLLNIIARLSTPFADFYLDKIFPFWNNTFGRLTSWLPFSLGEILIIIAVAGLPISLIVYIVLMCIKKGKRKRISHIYFKTLAWCVAYVLVTETLNCFIMYQCSTFASKNGISEDTYTTSQLLDVYEKLIEQTNEASAQVQRDENGKFILTADLDKTAAETMENISGDYPILKGFYTKPKPVINSYFMSQQYLMGVYFPFTLEANYNKLMYSSNKPETVVHELAHTQGIILEDEANFVAFLACSQSENAEYRYSGYLSALKYVRTRAFDAVQDKEPALRERLDEMETHIDYGIWVDMFENQAYWQDVQEDEEAIIPSSTVNELADAAMNGSLKFNGVADGKDSYGRMVDLLLNYYYDKGLV